MSTIESSGNRLVATESRPRKRRDWIPYVYIVPALLIYGAFFLYPAVQLVLLSFFEWDGITPREFVGLANYGKLLFEDPLFWVALRNNITWLGLAITVPVFTGLLLAILIVRSPLHGRFIFRTIYFMPQVLSSVVVAVIWSWIYNPNFGALNQALGALGLDGLKRGWLGDLNLALPAVFISWSWIHYGFTMVIFIAALQNIDELYFDAAKVDGANGWQQFRHILLPFLQGPLTTVVLVTAIAAFQVFDLVYIMTHGGPAYATLVLPVHMLDNALRFNQIGYGATIAVALGIVILVMSVVFLKVRGAFEDRVAI